MIKNPVRIAGVVCVLLFATFSVARADDSADHHWSKSWDVAAAPEVELTADRGSIRIVQGSANSIHANVDTEYWTIGSDVQVTDSLSGNHLEIRVHTPKEANPPTFPQKTRDAKCAKGRRSEV